MKFKSIKLHNFMRYKDDNILNFSCDPLKNVTIVLGDNTFGKTTLAQAFRWGLYEELRSTNYVNKKDIILLNNEVVELMKPGQREFVSIEIVMEDGDTQWKFTRKAFFKRKDTSRNSLAITQDGSVELTMLITEKGVPGNVISNTGDNIDRKTYREGCVQDAINNMLPRKLSNYFLFDGERWSDAKAVKAEIKDSIHTILGVTGYLEMKKHLKDNTRYNVLKKIQGNIQGSGNEYERLKKEIEDLDTKIVNCEDTIEEQGKQFLLNQKKRQELHEILTANHKVEEDQKEVNRLTGEITQFEDYSKSSYTDIVKLFSTSARYFASTMLPEVRSLLSKVELEGKDIPGVTVDTVDYLINKGTCLCGEKLIPDTKAYNNMMQLRKVIPPNEIGGAAGTFQDMLDSWGQDTKELIVSIEENARKFDDFTVHAYEAADEKEKIIKRMDRKTNMEQVRRQYDTFETLCRECEAQKNKAITQKEMYEGQRNSKIGQLEKLTAANKENKVYRLAIEYTEELYKMADIQAKKSQSGVLEELNEIIAENFTKMFNDSEKYAKLQDDYRVHVYYHSVGRVTDYEEQNLSNGESIAINFVYIVSILELARHRAQKQQNEGDDSNSGIIQLPLVLDGPFSNLSNENTNLVAKRLPEFAEQVIIFMLDKDWEASGLENFALSEYCYRVHKEDKSNSSTLEYGKEEY